MNLTPRHPSSAPFSDYSDSEAEDKDKDEADSKDEAAESIVFSGRSAHSSIHSFIHSSFKSEGSGNSNGSSNYIKLNNRDIPSTEESIPDIDDELLKMEEEEIMGRMNKEMRTLIEEDKKKKKKEKGVREV